MSKAPALFSDFGTEQIGHKLSIKTTKYQYNTTIVQWVGYLPYR